MISFAKKNFKDKLKYIARQIELDTEWTDDSDFTDNQSRYLHVDQYIMMLQSAANMDKIIETMDYEKVRPLIMCMKSDSQKIEAIKQFRFLFGEDLKTSKDEIERVMDWTTMQWNVDEWEWHGKLIAKGLKSI